MTRSTALKGRKPRQYKKGDYQRAVMQPAIRSDGEKLPRSVYIHCEEMNAKDIWKLIDWLYEAAKWMENGK